MKVKSFKKAESSVIWNTNKEGGWEKYLNLTSYQGQMFIAVIAISRNLQFTAINREIRRFPR